MGIHCRPSAVIVKESRAFDARIRVVSAAGECDPRSIMALISMGLAEGTPVTIQVSGGDEKKIARRMVELFERQFDFKPRETSFSPLLADPD